MRIQGTTSLKQDIPLPHAPPLFSNFQLDWTDMAWFSLAVFCMLLVFIVLRNPAERRVISEEAAKKQGCCGRRSRSE